MYDVTHIGGGALWEFFYLFCGKQSRKCPALSPHEDSEAPPLDPYNPLEFGAPGKVRGSYQDARQGTSCTFGQAGAQVINHKFTSGMATIKL